MNMTEPRDPLRESLENLRDRAAEAQPSGAKAQQVLADLQQGVQATLDQPGKPAPKHYRGLRKQLSAAVEHFEDEHAELTLAIGEVLDNLAAIGL
jgi:hypothetical protein